MSQLDHRAAVCAFRATYRHPFHRQMVVGAVSGRSRLMFRLVNKRENQSST